VNTKTVQDSQVVMSQLMLPTDANTAGYVHGGTILKIADTVAYACATHHAGNYCVTASVDRVDFKEPVKIGELVTFKASVVYVGKTSIQVGIRVEAEDIRTCKKRHTNSCYITCVALNNRGKPTKVPKLRIRTPEEKRRWREAEQRRKNYFSQRKK
jgi:uncharacterized protein (TIGR00369 family)